MRAWALMLGGLAVWAAHFMGVYAIASIADVAAHADSRASLWSVAALTIACLLADGWLLWRVVTGVHESQDELTRFVRALAGLGAALSLLAVSWQGLPALFAA